MTITIPEYITGEYAVGTECFSLTDNSRTEVLGDAAGNRKIAVRLYYPAPKAAVEGLPRAEVFSPQKLAAVTKAFHIKPITDRNILTGEFYENAPHAEGKFPLVLFSSGYNSYIEANNFLCCELASNGYFVASVGHANEFVENDYDDGTFDLFDKKINKLMYDNVIATMISQRRLQKAKLSPEQAAERFDAFQKKHTPYIIGRVSEWASDELFVFSELKSRCAEHIDFSRGTAASGHSLGGAAAYYLCQHSDEITCGINIDGGIFGDYTGMTMSKPFLQFSCSDNCNVETRSLINTQAYVQSEVFEQMTHIGFTDAKFYIPSKLLTGRMEGVEMYRRLSKGHLEFLDKFLKQGG
ncbi:MAG: hypothetical protein ACI4KM_00345 [Oscillospiraceae bacterium]